MMKKTILATLMIAAMVSNADATGKKQDRVVVSAPQQTTMIDSVPVSGTVVGSTVTFVREPKIDRVGRLARYYVCAPFELVGANCR